MQIPSLLPPLLLLLPLTACVTERSDDRYEPNDRPEEATLLELGESISARAMEGNPDVFAIDVGGEERLVLELRHRAFDCCVGFELTDPEGRTILSIRGGCPLILRPEIQEDWVEFRAAAERNDFEIEVHPTLPGRYFLTLVEGRTADGMGPYSWDFRLSAHLGE